jgi:hypothetical protein
VICLQAETPYCNAIRLWKLCKIFLWYYWLKFVMVLLAEIKNDVNVIEQTGRDVSEQTGIEEN